MNEVIDICPNLRVEIFSTGVAELIIGPVGGMPMTDERMHAELATIFPKLNQHPSIRAILIRSEGKGFCAGGSFSIVEDMLIKQEARLRVLREAREIVQGMIDCDVPIISAINGAAVGAGAALALMADITIAGAKAKIIDGHTKLGVAAGDHAAVIWPLLCGMAKAKYHLLMCNTIDGFEAERIGLVSLAVPDDELLPKAREIANTIAQSSPSAMAFTKRSLNHWMRAAWPAFENSLALEILGFAGNDAKIGLQAVKDKTTPEFTRVKS
jgi:enoyl-CoA hydratase